MLYVVVLYSDLTIKKELLSEIEKLSKDNVLFILVEDAEREGKLKNVTSCFNFDHYALCQKRDLSQDWIMLFGWWKNDFVWRRITECDSCNTSQVVNAPVGCMHVIFHGVDVEQDVWNEAQRIFNEEMI